jgi:hypothetical protein
MTLDEARAHIGDTVVYGHCHRPEEGEITSVRPPYVFVRYGWEPCSKATRPEDLTLLEDLIPLAGKVQGDD